MRASVGPALRFMAALSAAAVGTSCNGESGGEAASSQPTGGIQHMEVQVAQTVGIELGDMDYVFGTIADAVPTPSGGLIVLDMNTLSIREFDDVGTLTSRAGREGSGPGEFLMPRGMTILGNGKLLVSDMSAGAVSVFDDTLGWEMGITGFSPRPPFTLRAAGDSTYVGMLPKFDRAAGTMGYSVVMLGLSPEPIVTFAQEEYPFDPGRIGPSAEDDQPLFAAGADGSVYISSPGSDRIDVTGYTSAGDEFMTIRETIDRVEKTPEQLAAEEAEFEDRSSGMGGRRFGGAAVFDPDPYRRAVTELGVDSAGRLWVRLGAYPYPFWNVYGSTGELLFTASLELDDPDIDDMTVRIEENGAVAWVEDPGTWPRVNVLTLPD